MRWIKAVYSFLTSKTLTIWLAGLFIIYYITSAVWSKEAFASFVSAISEHNVWRILYVLLFLNVMLRTILAIKEIRIDRKKLLLRLPLYAGLVLFLFSFFMGLNVKENRWVLLGEEDILNVPWEEEPFRAVKIKPALKSDTLKVDDSLIFDYEPLITLMDSTGKSYEVGAFPPKKVSSTYMHILNFGIGPGVEVLENNNIVSEGYLALRLVPFGRVDTFDIEPFPYKFYLRILPNRVMKKGDETARSYNLDKPYYEVEITKGDKIIFQGKTDDTLSFDERMSINFFKPAYWVLLEVTYDPFFLWFALGIVLLLVGAIFYPFSFIHLAE